MTAGSPSPSGAGGRSDIARADEPDAGRAPSAGVSVNEMIVVLSRSDGSDGERRETRPGRRGGRRVAVCVLLEQGRGTSPSTPR